MEDRGHGSHSSEINDGPAPGVNSNTSSCVSVANPHYHHEQQNRTFSPMEIENDHNESSTGIDTTGRRHGTKYRAKTPTTPKPEETNKVVVIVMDISFLYSCNGLLRVLQVILTITTLVCLVTTGDGKRDLLSLPLSWHFRIMIFVLTLTLLFSVLSILANVTNLLYVFPFEWNFIDMLLYSVFAFLYLVATSLVASAFDFYQKMRPNISYKIIHQLVVCVALGYISMVLYALTAVCSYRTWKVNYHLYQRRRLSDEEIDI